MKYLMRIIESILAFFYTLLLWYSFREITGVDTGFTGFVFIDSLLPMMFLSLYYFLLVLSQQKHSNKENIISVLAYVFLNLSAMYYFTDLRYTYLIQFCTSLSIALFHYRKKSINQEYREKSIKSINSKSKIRIIEVSLGICYILISSNLITVLLSLAGFNYSSVRGLTFLFGTLWSIYYRISTPLFLLNLSYLLLTLSEYKHSRKKYIIFVALFLILNLVNAVLYDIQSDRYFIVIVFGREIIPFVISLSIAFFYYRRKRLESKN